MGIVIKISGAIDKSERDPSAHGDSGNSWVGMVCASWKSDHGETVKMAAIMRVDTGRCVGDLAWGPCVLQLRWIGDPPPPQIAKTVYDVIQDGGPHHRELDHVVDSMPVTQAQPSYRSVVSSRAS